MYRSASNVQKSASNVRIGFKCMNRPQMYRSTNFYLSDVSIYLSALLKLEIYWSVHWRPIRTFEANFCTFQVDLYIWGRFCLCTFEANPRAIVTPLPASLADFMADCTPLPGQQSPFGREISKTGRERCDSGLRPQMYVRKSASNVQISLKYMRVSVHLRQICTNGADFLSVYLSIYLSISFAKIGFKCTYIWGWSDSTGQGSQILRPVLLISRPIALPRPGNKVWLASNVRNSASNVRTFWGRSVHLRPISLGLKCTAVWLDGPQMYSCLIGSDTAHDKINYLCLKCMEFCTFEANSVHLRQIPYIWGRFCLWANQRAVHLRPIQSESCTFEAHLYIWGRFAIF